MSERFQVVIVGSGPAGLSAGGRAAARGLRHVVLERQPLYADTIQKYQRGKYVMATPDVLPLRSDMSFEAGSREEILGKWAQELEAQRVNIRYNSEVAAVKGRKGAFTVTLKDGTSLEAEAIVMAIGVQGNLRTLDIPGAQTGPVQYQLDDPDEYAGEHIMVVGAGDSAIENALALSAQNQVTIVNRRGEFARAKTGNLTGILKAAASGSLEVAYNAAPVRIGGGVVHLKTPEGTRELPCNRLIARLGADPPKRFLESCGIVFPKGADALYPEVSTTYESNVPGLYVIGALAGYPLIKHCMNQGYEVIETIAGHAVEPADEPVLRDRLTGMPGRLSVTASLDLIKSRVGLFRSLTTLQLREFMLDSDMRLHLAGETVFERNDYGDTLFCIVAGTVEMELLDERRPGAAPRLVRRHEGDFFGEAGLIAGRRRAGTARAATDLVLIELARRSAVKLLASSQQAARLFNDTTILRQLQDDLSPDLTDQDLAPVVAQAEIKRFAKGDVLIKQDDADDRSVYLIRSGSVTVSRRAGGKDIILAYQPAGHLVGEMALLRGGKRQASVTAAIDTNAIRIDGAAFERLLESRPAVREQIEQTVLERLQHEPQGDRSDRFSGVTSFLMGEGVGEARDILLIDESLCVRCDNCEKACAESHDGVSRLDREAGPTFAMVHVPTSCRHCEHPHCMADCPPDAIHRGETGEVWIDHDRCIGCENCARNCPYGVIQMALPPPPKPGLLQWLLLGRGPGPGGNRRLHMAAKDKKKAAKAGGGEAQDKPKAKLAYKCDMCAGIAGGPACVRACPTGAAIRVSPKDFLENVLNRA